MAKKDKKEDKGPEYRALDYSLVAARAFSDDDPITTRKSLQRLVGDTVIENSPAREAYMRIAGYNENDKTNKDLVANAINGFMSAYNEYRGKRTVEQYIGDFSSNIMPYLGAQNLENIVKEFGSEKIGDIEEKIAQAKEAIESKTKRYKKEDKEEAQKTLEKYKLIQEAINRAQNDSTTSLYNPLKQETMKEQWEERYKPKEDKGKKNKKS